MTQASEDSMPIVEPPSEPPSTDHVVAGILLAAGESSRFANGNKLLATLDGDPIVRRAGQALATAGVTPRFVVLGNNADGVEAALEGLGYQRISNPAYADGQATSLRAGINALDDVDAALIALGDMPMIDPRSIHALVNAYRADAGSALAAAFEGRRGNPVLFDERHFETLLSVTGDTGGRQLLLEQGVLVETGDPGVLQDVDTREDLASLQRG
ncbi:MAG: NTP transferase domain-containing protein [Salinirussus sp.]